MKNEKIMSYATRKSWLTGGYFLSFIAIGMGIGIKGPTLQALGEQTHSSLDEISIILSTLMAGYFVASVPGSRLLDRVRGEYIFGAALSGMVMSVLFIPLTPSRGLLGALTFLFGLSMGFIDAGGNAMLVWLHRDKVGPFMNALHFCFGLGGVLSPLIVGWIVRTTGGIKWAYWILGLFIVPLIILMLRLPAPSPPKVSKASESKKSSGRMILVMLVVMFFLYGGIENVFSNFIFTYSTLQEVLNEVNASYLNSGFWAALTVGRLIAIPFAVRLRPSTLLAADLLGVLSGAMIILIMPASPIALWMGTLLCGFSMASFFPTLISLGERTIPMTGSVMAMLYTGISVGGIIWPWVTTKALIGLGNISLIWLILIITVVTIMILGAVGRFQSRKGEGEKI